MIRAIITDIDGVLVGDKIGYNSPYPHPDVVTSLKTIHASGLPVILCTAKPHYAIHKIITDCQLDNPHITDNGAVLIDPITNKIINKYVMDKTLVSGLVRAFLSAGMYVEIYTSDKYLIQKSESGNELTRIHTHILQTEPKEVVSLLHEVEHLDIVKVMPIAADPEDTKRLLTLADPFKDRINIGIAQHPIANPRRFGSITAAGVSKRQAAIEIMDALHISLSDCLGIGDSTTDWSFMELCGCTATVGNGSEDLKTFITSKGAEHGFISSKTVDENGMLDILDRFSLQ